MNKLKQNAFWAICGALGAVLVIAFVVVVVPRWTDRDTQNAQVGKYRSSLTSLIVPSDLDIKAWNDRKAECIADYREIAKLYLERDTDLEKWLEKVANIVPPGQAPAPDQYMNPYQDAAKELETSLKNAGVGVGMVEPPKEEGDPPKYHFGFNWEKLDVDWGRVTDPKVRADVIRLVQKRYWIARHIANACVEGDRPVAVVKRVLDLYYFRALHEDTTTFRQTERQSGTARAPEYINSWVRPPGAIRFVECELPDMLGQTISFGVAVECSFEKAPKFIHNLLSPSQSPRIIVNITAMRMFAATQNHNEVVEDKPYRQDEPPPDVATMKAESERSVKPVSATIWLTCQVIDFDPGKLPGFATK